MPLSLSGILGLDFVRGSVHMAMKRLLYDELERIIEDTGSQQSEEGNAVVKLQGSIDWVDIT